MVADAGGFGDKGGVGDVSATGAPLLDSANLGPLLTGGTAIIASWGFQFFREGLEPAFGFLDQVFNLVGPCFHVVEGVDHLFEREWEVCFCFFAFVVAEGVGGGRAAFAEPRKAKRNVSGDTTMLIVSRQEI